MINISGLDAVPPLYDNNLECSVTAKSQRVLTTKNFKKKDKIDVCK
jgi:hypothetical protein